MRIPWYLAYAQDIVISQIMHILDDTFLLDAVRIMFTGEVSKVNVTLIQEQSVNGDKQFKVGCSTNSGCQQAFVDFFAEINKVLLLFLYKSFFKRRILYHNIFSLLSLLFAQLLWTFRHRDLHQPWNKTTAVTFFIVCSFQPRGHQPGSKTSTFKIYI